VKLFSANGRFKVKVQMPSAVWTTTQGEAWASVLAADAGVSDMGGSRSREGSDGDEVHRKN
jgi:hypothetical protein